MYLVSNFEVSKGNFYPTNRPSREQRTSNKEKD